ncbi:hypothetical protein F5144DRAFT_599363 [Chaetomium tenue]|uniref:Uncharacterized protein n=1 Tax=Chaetomium tenue TaxID=1854479 RepID=A0ACB7PFT7_9PEZI|nr:hypothetical protein F5144DRAFT_599363 [Chaetomium globosum]
MESLLSQPSNPPTKPTTPHLPPTRTLLTTLLNAIAAIPLTPSPTTQPPPTRAAPPPPPPTANQRSENKNKPPQENPLRRVPASHRHLIVTLHVLFPGLVLPALDLLERGFVARVALADCSTSSSSGGGGAGIEGGGVEGGDGGVVGEASARGGGLGKSEEGMVLAGAGGERRGGRGNAFYLVQSAAAVEAARERRRRRKHSDDGDEADGVGGMGMGSQEKGYIVRLDAWHCSCAAFAFAAVQGEITASYGRAGGEREMGFEYASAEPSGVSVEAAEWSFGGMSLDGLEAGDGEGVPVCKHLLACLLAERWDAALGQYVVERRVRKEEMAGIVADV